MSFGKTVTMRRRILSATWALVINVILWIVIPYYLGIFLVKYVPDLPLGIPAFVYEFGILFTILDVGAAFFQGMAISVPFLSGAAILSAVYLWFVTNGGYLHVTASGLDIELGFRLLVYLFVVPSLWAAIRAPLSYLIWRRAGPAPPQAPAPTP
ncbi:MAG: hypothetical protein JRM99_04650 [Nitrososphaerota archaeon]|nr:hypothetical protein [Nitrososphaerota archaeon]